MIRIKEKKINGSFCRIIAVWLDGCIQLYAIIFTGKCKGRGPVEGHTAHCREDVCQPYTMWNSEEVSDPVPEPCQSPHETFFTWHENSLWILADLLQ